MLSTNQIAGFLSHLSLQNKLMKQLHFLHDDTNSQKLKVDQNFFGLAWANMSVANWSLNSKIDYISRINRWN